MSTPSIPGVDCDALTDAIIRATGVGSWLSGRVAEAALAHIAAHHECACDREHADEWVELDHEAWYGLPNGTRLRQEWVRNHGATRTFVHRDDLPDPHADPVERMAQALHAADVVSFGWDTERNQVREKYRTLARVALGVARKEENR